uniref:Uncharacterized protein n=1 Tax=Bionectria ochroleuca TaxID=29856 RepID=A0A0B7K6G6_BIOOC
MILEGGVQWTGWTGQQLSTPKSPHPGHVSREGSPMGSKRHVYVLERISTTLSPAGGHSGADG